ncbi:protein FAR1-RELATED SEQUENCE 5-like [Salvia divinorum]|uniref:Protein FAR1-RELATED SEQUENCE 5-like n=1 Tax=Salvia divinorum TaxID=28513 RepID=A0ABD1I6T9_SALDI
MENSSSENRLELDEDGTTLKHSIVEDGSTTTINNEEDNCSIMDELQTSGGTLFDTDSDSDSDSVIEEDNNSVEVSYIPDCPSQLKPYIVSFATTYSTNRYCMIFAPFTGKDNHVMEKYGLSNNAWFSSMFASRKYWVPAFFRDFPMSSLIKTTSVSES